MFTPLFPKFKEVKISDKAKIEAVTKKHPPYCDFNFSNIYNWSDKDFPTQFCFIDSNLIIRMRDFTTDKIITSFIGKDITTESVKTLLNCFGNLTMIPETAIDKSLFDDPEIEIVEDINNHDYIMSLEKLTTLEGHDLKPKRKRITRFLKENPEHIIKVVDFGNKKSVGDIKDLFLLWAKLKLEDPQETKREMVALDRYIKTSHIYKMANVGIYINKKLIAFTANEINGIYAMGGFGKADFTYNGIYAYLEHATAKILQKYGCKYLNYEQDLGIEGLRESKKSWKPVSFLKKYVIRHCPKS